MREPGSDDDEAPAFTDAEVMQALRAQIPGEEVKTRKGNAGRTEWYIKDFTIRKRLDQAAGAENWSSEEDLFFKSSDDWAILLVKCRIIVTLPSGKVVHRDGIGASREQVLDQNGKPIPGKSMKYPDALKSGSTDAFKKAALKFGIGVWLGTPVGDGSYEGTPPSQRDGAKKYPNRGEWGTTAGASRNQGTDDPDQGNRRPRTGKALFAWSMERNKDFDDGTDVVKAIQAMGQGKGWPQKMVDWSPDDVSLAYDWACLKIRNKRAQSESPAE